MSDVSTVFQVCPLRNRIVDKLLAADIDCDLTTIIVTITSVYSFQRDVRVIDILADEGERANRRAKYRPAQWGSPPETTAICHSLSLLLVYAFAWAG